MSTGAVQPAGSIDTIPTKVNWQERRATDLGCAFLYLVALMAWFDIGFAMMGAEMEVFETDENGMITGWSQDVKTAGKECCTQIQEEMDTPSNDYNENGGICMGLDTSRRLTESDKFPNDGGMFDVFALRPEVPTVMIMSCIVMAVAWIMLLRSFAKTVVFGCEFVKIIALAYLGVECQHWFFFAIAAGYAIYTWCFREKLKFAAKIIKHAANGLKENPSMFIALFTVKAFYVVQALLYIKFFEASMKVKEVAYVSRESVDYGQAVCSLGSQYTCEYSLGYDANHCDANGGVCEYPITGGVITECQIVEKAWVGSARWYLMAMWLWSVMFFTQFRLVIVANILGSWHWHPDNKPSPMQALQVASTKSFGTTSYSAIICAIVEKFYNETKWKWWQMVPPFLCYMGPYKLLCCLAGWCLKTCIQMLTKFSLIISVFTGDNFFGSAKKCYGIMKRHFVGGFITEASSKQIMTIFSLVMAIALCFSTWAWVDTLFGFKTIPGASDDLLWILWCLLASFCIYHPVLGLFFLSLLDSLMKSITSGDNAWKDWVSPLAAIFVGCIAKLFFDYMGGIFLDSIDVMFLCFAIDKDNNVDLSKSEFAAICVDIPGVITANPMTESKDPLLVQQPVQPGQFVAATGVPQQGQIEPFGAPGAGVQMMPMGGQPGMMPMAQQGMMPMAQPGMTPEQQLAQMQQQTAMMQQQMQQQQQMMMMAQQPQQATM
uniref:Choline transporter-like protein n=1 Tax=Triparma pacifica TaxID=91992 RepID=A0A7S2VW62_9STRA